MHETISFPRYFRPPIAALVLGFVLSSLLIAVVSAGPTMTKGRIPNEAFGTDGTIDASLVPDFVAVYSRDGESIAGYVPKSYLVGSKRFTVVGSRPEMPEIPVVGDDLKSIVGRMVPGIGFVPAGVDAGSLRAIPVEVSAE